MFEGTSVKYKSITKSILDLANLYKNNHLNLEPGFQRDSVWTMRDRQKLVDSIIKNYPLPAIFLYKNEVRGRLIFDVIDGKQRIESILLFIGLKRPQYDVKRVQLSPDSEPETVNWSVLKRRQLQAPFFAYEIPIIEVDGDIGDIIDLFVRINSTGKALTRQEQRHAKYYRSSFLRGAGRLASTFEDYFRANRILSTAQISRMKHVELLCELMLSLDQGDVLNKKAALNRVLSGGGYSDRQVKRAASLASIALRRVQRMFPDLKTTRFRQLADFYSLVVLIGKFEAEGLILTEKRRNGLAWDLLKAFSTKVDEVRELQRKARGAGAHQELYRDYLLTVAQGTDEVNQRRKRESILRGLLASLFARKDSQRGFSPEQRRIIWNSSADRRCSVCKTRLTWEDFTIDHIDPHSKGGATRIENATLMCRKHNSAKGNRR